MADQLRRTVTTAAALAVILALAVIWVTAPVVSAAGITKAAASRKPGAATMRRAIEHAARSLLRAIFKSVSAQRADEGFWL